MSNRPRTRPSRVAPIAGALLCTAALAAPWPASAAEVRVRGEAPFRIPSAETLRALPADAPIRADDVRAGSIGFEIVYDDAAPDADPDAYSGRYDAAIRAFRVRVGGTWHELPVAAAQLRVSDGGGGMAHRESLAMTGVARHGALELRAGWVQLNQAPPGRDLRGTPGVIGSDALPRGDAVTRFETSGEFDRVFYVRLDPVGDTSRPVLYLSTSSLSVDVATAGSGR